MTQGTQGTQGAQGTQGTQGAQGALVGLVLAGGSSRRFGRDKSTHPVDGVEMRIRVGLTLGGIAADVLLSAGADVCRSARERPVSEAWPFSACLEDVVENAGPLAGLHAAMAHVHRNGSKATHLLVAPCDMPWLSARSLQKLVSAASDDACDAAVAECDGRLTGVVGCYRVALLAALEAFLANAANGRSVERFLRSLRGVARIGLPPGEARNVNHPEDIPRT